MLRFILMRLGSGLGVALAVFLVTFLLLRAAPGSAGAAMDQVGEDVQWNQAQRLGTQRPLGEHLTSTAGSWLRGDLGRSLVHGEPVTEVLARTWPISLELGLNALFIALLLGTSGGLIAGFRQRSKVSTGLVMGSLVLISLSALGLGTMARIALAGAGRFTLGGWDEPLDRLLPALILGLVYGAYVLELVRASTREALGSPWVAGARARGVPRRSLIFGYVLPGALIPMVETMGPIAAKLLTGSFVVEVLFEVPGISRAFMDAAAARDAPVILGIVMVYTLTVTLLNTGLEVAHAALDPRLRSGEAHR